MILIFWSTAQKHNACNLFAEYQPLENIFLGFKWIISIAIKWDISYKSFNITYIFLRNSQWQQ